MSRKNNCFMSTKVVKYLLSVHILFLSMYATAQSLSGDVQTVHVVDSDSLYPLFKDIVYNCIVGAFSLQIGVMIYNVCSNTNNAKRTVKQLIVSTAIFGLIWAIL